MGKIAWIHPRTLRLILVGLLATPQSSSLRVIVSVKSIAVPIAVVSEEENGIERVITSC